MTETRWRYEGGWIVVTQLSPAQTGLEPMAVYYPRSGVRWFQYRVASDAPGF
jgi:hypothetical protein